MTYTRTYTKRTKWPRLLLQKRKHTRFIFDVNFDFDMEKEEFCIRLNAIRDLVTPPGSWVSKAGYTKAIPESLCAQYEWCQPATGSSKLQASLPTRGSFLQNAGLCICECYCYSLSTGIAPSVCSAWVSNRPRLMRATWWSNKHFMIPFGTREYPGTCNCKPGLIIVKGLYWWVHSILVRLLETLILWIKVLLLWSTKCFGPYYLSGSTVSLS